jgi:hypothetical protein
VFTLLPRVLVWAAFDTHTHTKGGSVAPLQRRSLLLNTERSVEICITLGRMTDSPFSPVNRFPPNDHTLYTRPHVKYPGKVDLLLYTSCEDSL